MQLRVASWNIHGAVASSRSSVTQEATAELVRSLEVDILGVQEAEFSATAPEPAPETAQLLASFGLPHLTSFPLSPSHHHPGRRLGLALAHRWPAHSVRRELLPNPHLELDTGRGRVTTHDKGYLTMRLDTPAGPVEVCTLHQFPFRRFKAKAGSSPLHATWAAFAAALDTPSGPPLVVTGDFNSDDRTLFTDCFRHRLFEAHPPPRSRPWGGTYDDVLVSGRLEIEQIQALPTFSDHMLVLADVVLPPGGASDDDEGTER